MGTAIDPSDTFTYVLADDRAKPAESQRKIEFHYVSARDAGRIEKLFAAAREIDDVALATSKAAEGIAIAIAGGGGVEAVESTLSRASIAELRDNLVGDLTVSEIDKKKSALRSQFISGVSASQATPAAA